MYDDLQNLADSNGLAVHSQITELDQVWPLIPDLNQLVIERPISTHLFRIKGHSWIDQGLYDGDIAVIDRSPIAGISDLIVARRGRSSTILRQHQITPEDKPWGVITAVIRKLR